MVGRLELHVWWWSLAAEYVCVMIMWMIGVGGELWDIDVKW